MVRVRLLLHLFSLGYNNYNWLKKKMAQKGVYRSPPYVVGNGMELKMDLWRL